MACSLANSARTASAYVSDRLQRVYTRASDLWLNRIIKYLLAASLLLGDDAQGMHQAGIVIANVAPDAVATALNPVPIFNFAVHNVAFSPDGQTLATGDGTGIVRLWNLPTGELKATVPAHTNWAFSVAWARDGKTFATGGGDNAVRLFDAVNPTQPLKTFIGHSNDVHAVAFTPDGLHLVSTGDDRHIIVWNIATAVEARRWPAHRGPIPGLDVSPG
jgi:hypothetical protein